MSTRTVTQIITSTAQYFLAFTSSAINIALPTIGSEFHSNAIILGWMTLSFVLIMAVLFVPVGRISDSIGIKKVFICGMLVFVASSIIALFSVSDMMVLAVRCAQGLGGSLVFGNGMSLITRIFPKEERGRALGINSGSVYLGLTSGPFLGGLLTEHFGWRSIFVMTAVAGVFVVTFALWKIKGDWSEKRAGKFDIVGSLLYALVITLVMYGFSELSKLQGLVLIALGILVLPLFIRWESRVAMPVLEIKLFRENKIFVLSNIAALINYATYSIAFLLSLYLQYVKGLSPDKAGLIMLSQPLTQAIIGPFAGRLSDRIEPRIVSTAGMTLNLVGQVLMFIFLNKDTSVFQMVFCLVILGAGFALFVSPNTNAIMSSVSADKFSLASAVVGTMRTIGQTLSMGIIMLVMALYLGPVVITPEYHSALIAGTKTTFAIFAVLCVGGILASFSRGNVRAARAMQGKSEAQPK